MQWNPAELPLEVKDFLAERQLATLSIPRPGKSPHVTPVGFTWDDVSGLARVITFADARKVKLLAAAGAGGTAGLQVALCQVDGGRWLTLEGTAQVTADPSRCAIGTELYGRRYQPPKDRGSDRRVIEIKVTRIKGRVPPPVS